MEMSTMWSSAPLKQEPSLQAITLSSQVLDPRNNLLSDPGSHCMGLRKPQIPAQGEKAPSCLYLASLHKAK